MLPAGGFAGGGLAPPAGSLAFPGDGGEEGTDAWLAIQQIASGEDPRAETAPMKMDSLSAVEPAGWAVGRGAESEASWPDKINGPESDLTVKSEGGSPGLAAEPNGELPRTNSTIDSWDAPDWGPSGDSSDPGDSGAAADAETYYNVAAAGGSGPASWPGAGPVPTRGARDTVNGRGHGDSAPQLPPSAAAEALRHHFELMALLIITLRRAAKQAAK